MESLIIKGGWVMAPILLGSVVALTLVLERMWFFATIRLNVHAFSGQIFSAVRAGQLDEAKESCRRVRHPIGQVFLTGLEHAGEGLSEIERAMEREARRQISFVEKNLNFLVVVIGVEPLLGFLGTILGLIKAFMAWERLGASVSVSALAAGIYQAMITTAAGLIVAIPYYVIYNMLLSKVNSTAQEVNHYGDELLSVLHQSEKIKE